MPLDDIILLDRRTLLGSASVLALAPLLGACGSGAGASGSALIMGITSDPTGLVSAYTSAGAAQTISPKIFDGLLGYSADLKPQPRLALEWQFDEEAKALTLKLRPGVKWHDGKDFSSADVAYSALEVWRKFHSRGRMTYANLIAVDTPDPLTAVLRFSKPAPYVISALASNESQVLPKHLYAGRDVLTNPVNIAPVGTGPFRFAEWQRGQFIRLERNADYWDQGKPHLDGLIFRILGDPAAHAVALETGEIHLTSAIAAGDVARLSKLPNVKIDRRNFGLVLGGSGLEFNLDVPKLQDVRIRQAVAHAIDVKFIIDQILLGNGVIDTGPISPVYKDFYTPDVPRYPYDPARAIALLDEAGLKPDAKGVRLSFTLDPTPGTDRSQRIAEYIRSALSKVGIQVKLQNQDFATFVRKVYTQRNFEVILAGGQMGPDPAIGTQRFYWSKSFQPGVAFSNGSHYANAVVDQALEAGQSEIDPAKRRAAYATFQRQAQLDLPRIPLYSTSNDLFYSARMTPLDDNAEGTFGNFANVKLSA
jgi:peptide/nickel transport system substrate-binding protein